MSNLDLKNFWQSFKKDKYLLAALFLGLILRGLNPTFGSPTLFVSNDEAIAHLSAYNMIANKTLYSIANYTPFGSYVQIPFLIGSYIMMRIFGIVTSISDFELFILTHEGYFLFIPRLISALFGTLIILVIYKITLELFKKKQIAIISAFLATVSFNLVHISNAGRPWSAMLFFTSLAILFALKKKNGYSLFFCAIGFGFHQAAVLVLPLLILLNKVWTFSYFVKIVFFLIIILILNSLVISQDLLDSINNNQSFLYSNRLITDLLAGNKNLIESIFRTIYLNLSVYYVKNFAVTDIVILAFGCLGIFHTFKEKPESRVIVLYILSYFIFASLFFHPLIRYLLPLFILLIPFAGFAISRYINSRILLIVLLIFASLNSVWWVSIYIKKPTFVLAQEWIKNNTDNNIPLVYTGGRFNYLVPNKSAVNYTKKISDDSFKRLQNIEKYNSENVRNVIYLNKITGVTLIEKLKKINLEYGIYYVIDYYLDPKDSLYFNNPSSFTVFRRFSPTKDGRVTGIAEPLFDSSSNFDSFDRRKNGSMYALERTGPYFDVLKIKGVRL